MIEIKEPTARDLRIFGLLWPLFFGALGGIVLWKAEGLLVPATVLAAAWLVSLALNTENRPRQLTGVLLPALFGVCGGSVVAGARTLHVAISVWTVAALGAAAIWIAPSVGRRIYLGWMIAAQPIGWTFSHLVLATVYYAVLTPVGWLMRVFGYDPMARQFDRAASSYWIERPAQSDASRYFRQF